MTMHRLTLTLAALLSAAAPVQAQDGLREGDALLDNAALTELVSGQVLEFHDGSLASYARDGGYVYAYSSEGPAFRGIYQVRDDSSVCIAFENGFKRCDFIVRDGDRHVMIIQTGDRFPIKEVRPLD